MLTHTGRTSLRPHRPPGLLHGPLFRRRVPTPPCSKAGDGQGPGDPNWADPWETQLTPAATLSSLYQQRNPEVEFKQIDHMAKRRERDIKEICEVGGRWQGAGRVPGRMARDATPRLSPSHFWWWWLGG